MNPAYRRFITPLAALGLVAVSTTISLAESSDPDPIESIPLYAVHELVFRGPHFTERDAPARDVELLTRWRHESGRELLVYGFWDGDGWSKADVIEAHLGAFLDGGYGTTGHKPAPKQGHYFWGAFKPSEHRAADNRVWLRRQIDRNITFWRMSPYPLPSGPSHQAFCVAPRRPEFRALAWPGREYLLGTNAPHARLRAYLPPGAWQVVLYDVITRRRTVLAENARHVFTFDAPDSRAALFHFRKTE